MIIPTGVVALGLPLLAAPVAAQTQPYWVDGLEDGERQSLRQAGII